MSNVKGIVDAQQYLFETMWRNAIPAEDKIRELEEGVVPDFIKTISDPEEIQKLTFELTKFANKEILIIFSTANAFRRQAKVGLIELLKRIVQVSNNYNLNIKILTPVDNSVKDIVQREVNVNLIDLNIQYQEHQKEQEQNRLQFRSIGNSFQSKVSILVVDRKYSLVVELKDDTKENFYDAIGFATYSNSKSTVLSYASIFESLWKQVELYEKVKLHDMLQKDFVNIAAHELRTPIQPILILSESLKTRVTDNEGVKMADIINRNALRLQQLSEDILDITRIETHSLKINKSQFDLNDLIRKIVNDFSKHITNESNITLKTNLTNDRLLVQADRGRITQVINNLINNAIKFTTKGIITIGIENNEEKEQLEKMRTHNGRMIMVYVKDTGIGIDPEIFPRLFEKFVTKSSGGTGLGLYISKNIVTAHNGRIWATNSLDRIKGATFTFSIPV